ncbi:hypothetical protein V1522DRAFT_456196 [Lipomyces starkeyi]
MNYRNRQYSEQLSVINANENIIVRYNIRTQDAISRSALEFIHTECKCATRIRYLLPCSHQIQLDVLPQVAQVHPRWRIQGALPASSAIADINDIAVLVKRKRRPRESRRLATSADIVQRVADRTKRVRRCGSGKRVGHTRRTCPIPVQSANDASIQVEQLLDEDEPPETNDEDDSLERDLDDILSTIEQVNGACKVITGNLFED